MSRTREVMTFVVAVAMVPALAAGQGTSANNGPKGRYQEQDTATRTTFTATTDDAGNAVLTLKGGDFVLEKVLAHTGDATLRLSQGKDVVTIAVSQTGFHIARGRKTVHIDPRHDHTDKPDRVRVLLSGSQAVRSFKRLIAAFEGRDDSEPDGPLALSALVDGAVVHLLDGDLDAPLRIAKRITRKQRSAVRLAAAKRLPGAFIDCVGLYQISLMSAYGQFESCAIEATGYSWWNRDLVYDLCSWEWALRSNQYIWQFIGCFMLPW